MEKILRSTDLKQILERAPLLSQLANILQDYAQLASVDEGMLLEHYFPAIINDNVTPFLDFNQAHRDAYLRIRFRAENRR